MPRREAGAPGGERDIGALAAKALAFRETLNVAKARAGAGIPWYPYESLSSFALLDRLLTGERRDLMALAGGKPVLDLGCADGALAFFLESLGATVDALDCPSTNCNGMRGVVALKAALGSSVAVHAADLDRAFSLPRGRYGLIFFLGTLYHLKNPFHVLETLSLHARYCVLSTRIAGFSPGGKRDLRDLPVAYLLGEREANDDPTNFWVFSERGLRRLLERTGWEVCDFMTTGGGRRSDPAGNSRDERAFCLARSLVDDPAGDAELLAGWHGLEQRSWRWTERRFSCRFHVGAASAAHELRLRFCVPEAAALHLCPLTLSATANGCALGGQTYGGAGDHTYAAVVPSAAAGSPTVRIDFELDKALAPDELDARERGIVVTGLEIRPVPQ